MRMTTTLDRSSDIAAEALRGGPRIRSPGPVHRPPNPLTCRKRQLAAQITTGERPTTPARLSQTATPAADRDSRAVAAPHNRGVRLLVAALDSELVAFPSALPGFDRLVTGPGKLQGAVRLARALEAASYEEIVVVGTAGAIDPDLPAVVHEVGGTVQHDVTDIDGIVGQHVSLPPRVDTASGEVTIATGDHFVDDAEAVAGIRELGAGLVDMESYAYAWVATEYDVPIRIFKAVSDNAQDDALTDWRAAVAACSVLLRERIRDEYGV